MLTRPSFLSCETWVEMSAQIRLPMKGRYTARERWREEAVRPRGLPCALCGDTHFCLHRKNDHRERISRIKELLLVVEAEIIQDLQHRCKATTKCRRQLLFLSFLPGALNAGNHAHIKSFIKIKIKKSSLLTHYDMNAGDMENAP